MTGLDFIHGFIRYPADPDPDPGHGSGYWIRAFFIQTYGSGSGYRSIIHG